MMSNLAGYCRYQIDELSALINDELIKSSDFNLLIIDSASELFDCFSKSYNDLEPDCVVKFTIAYERVLRLVKKVDLKNISINQYHKLISYKEVIKNSLKNKVLVISESIDDLLTS